MSSDKKTSHGPSPETDSLRYRDPITRSNPMENSRSTDESVRSHPSWLANHSARVVLKALLILAMFYTLYLAKTLILPIVIAGFLALFCNPLVVALQRRWLPQVVAAVTVMIMVCTLLVGTFTLLAQPAEKWIAAVPYATADITARINKAAAPAGNPTQALAGEPAPATNGTIADQLRNRFFGTFVSFALSSTPILLTQILAVVILVYFFLVYSAGMLRRLIEIRPAMSEKRTTVVIVRTIQADVSHYVLVISIINTGLGAATALTMWALGVRDPILWGAMAAMLNFAPYIGPFIMTLVLAFVGYIQFGATGYALLIPSAYLCLNFLECQLVTPTALGNRLHLNPLVVFVWLILWGWMWGAAGMLIAVPLLVCVKIIATHLHIFDPWIALIDG